MDRPTTNLILPNSKASVTFYTYLTMGELRRIRRSSAESMKLTYDPVTKEPVISDLNGGIAFQIQDLTIKFLVKEIILDDGSKVEDIQGFIDNLDASDGTLIYDKAEELSKDSNLNQEDKKK